MDEDLGTNNNTYNSQLQQREDIIQFKNDGSIS